MSVTLCDTRDMRVYSVIYLPTELHVLTEFTVSSLRLRFISCFSSAFSIRKTILIIFHRHTLSLQ